MNIVLKESTLIILSIPPEDLHMIFEKWISKNGLRRNPFLVYFELECGYTGSKNQVWKRLKMDFANLFFKIHLSKIKCRSTGGMPILFAFFLLYLYTLKIENLHKWVIYHFSVFLRVKISEIHGIENMIQADSLTIATISVLFHTKVQLFWEGHKNLKKKCFDVTM